MTIHALQRVGMQTSRRGAGPGGSRRIAKAKVTRLFPNVPLNPWNQTLRRSFSDGQVRQIAEF
jgi:hypothetical protein